MKTILLKVSGKIFSQETGAIQATMARSLVNQIKQLNAQNYRFGIVIGGGNFFRGAQQGKALQMQRAAADHVGMLATVMNGIILNDVFSQAGVASTVLNALAIPGVADIISDQAIHEHLQQNRCIIFTGGTGCPYFSTDTNAVIRALQIGATELWKATNVDYLYDADPATNPQAKPITTITMQEAFNKNLRVMDAAAFALARDHHLPIRVFNIWKQDALLNAAQDATFGSTITV